MTSSDASPADTAPDTTTALATATQLLRVEKGHAEPEEVAALAAILLARASSSAAASAPAARRGRNKAGWRRLERTPGFRAPHSWQG